MKAFKGKKGVPLRYAFILELGIVGLVIIPGLIFRKIKTQLFKSIERVVVHTNMDLARREHELRHLMRTFSCWGIFLGWYNLPDYLKQCGGFQQTKTKKGKTAIVILPGETHFLHVMINKIEEEDENKSVSRCVVGNNTLEIKTPYYRNAKMWRLSLQIFPKPNN